MKTNVHPPGLAPIIGIPVPLKVSPSPAPTGLPATPPANIQFFYMNMSVWQCNLQICRGFQCK